MTQQLWVHPTSIETTNTQISDNSIVLNKGETGAGVTAGTAGLEIDPGSEDAATFIRELKQQTSSN